MMKFLHNPYLNLIIRLFLGGIFVVYGASKINDAPFFANEINNYNLFPALIQNFTAIVLPWVELIAGLFMIAGVKIKANSAIISFLLVVFIIAVASAMAQGLDINCGCSKANPEKVGLKKLAENTGLLLLSLHLLFSKSTNVYVLQE